MSESMAFDDVEVTLNGITWTCYGMVEFDVEKGEPMRMPQSLDDDGYPGDPDEISDITVTEITSITCEDKDGNEHTFSYEGEHQLLTASEALAKSIMDYGDPTRRPDEDELKEQIEVYFDANLEELNYE